MAIPKFYLEPRPSKDGKQNINMFYSFNGQRLQYYTGIRIETKYFRPECNNSNVIKPIRNTAPYAAQYNGKLENIKNSAVTIVNQAKGEELTVKHVREQLDLIYKPKIEEPIPEPDQHTFISYFEQLIADSKAGKRLISTGGKQGSRYTHGTIKNYSVALSAIKRYMKHKGLKHLPLDSVNKEFYEDFRNYCYNMEEKEKSTFGVYVKNIKTVMMESKGPNFDTKDFKRPGYEADTLYLTNAEIDKISAADFSDSYKTFKMKRGKLVEVISYTTLDKARDLSLIGFYSGLRFSDFSKLDLKNIDGDFIKVKQAKTGKLVVIPIMQKLRPILEKYKNGLPTLSNQRFNNYIKIVAELAGLTEMRTLKNTKGNTENETTAPLYSLISSHCCRRSYATNLFRAGYSAMLIMAATGHKTETSFLKYIRATNEDKANLLANELKKAGL